jgi:hypothetical protein
LTATGRIPAGMEAGSGGRGRPGQTQTRSQEVNDLAGVGAVDAEGAARRLRRLGREQSVAIFSLFY